MLTDLLINIGASVIYDFGKAIKNQAAKNETVQVVLKKLGASPTLHDFPQRYVEALVEFRFLEKSPAVMAFFREESIAQVFYDFYYGDKGKRDNEPGLLEGIAHWVKSLKVGDDVKAVKVDVEAEVKQFWGVFRQKVQESRTVKEAEVIQTLNQLKTRTDDIHEMLRTFQATTKAQGKSEIQIADKIYNIDKIDTAFFGALLKKTPRYLTLPPFNPDYFIGRDKDLKAIEAEYQQNYRLLMLVNGEGGIGKTTLAAKYWYQHESRYQHLAWLYSDQGIGAALLSLADKLGLQFAPEADEATQIERITEVLNNLDKPCLLVFDNANNAVDLEAHYVRLNRLTNCHILLTSRVKRLQEMKVYEVFPLNQEDAVALFRKYYPKLADGEESLLHDILNAVGYNTLVTEVLAKNLAAFNRFSAQYSLAGLLEDFQQKGLLALKNKAVKVAYGSDTLRTAEPSEIIGAMYDLAQLSDTERYLLSNLAVLPAENIPYDLLKTLLEAGDETFDDTLTGLEEKGWLDFREENNSFKISPVIQEITRNKNAERLLGDCHALIRSLQSGLDGENRHKDNYQTASLLARMGETVIYSISVPDDDVATLCQNIGDYHKDTGNLSLMMKAYQKMADLQTALCEADPDNAHFKNGLAISYSKLGETHTSLGNLQQALTFFEQRSRLGKELYEAYPQNVAFKNGLAISYEKLGSTHTSLGNLQQALTFFEDETQLFEELYEAYPQNVAFKNGLAISYSKLGSTHTSLGNLQQALTFFEKDIELTKELYEAYPQNVDFKNGLAISYSQLGRFYRDQKKDKKTARAFFEKCRDLWKELSETFPYYPEFQNNFGWAENALSKLGD